MSSTDLTLGNLYNVVGEEAICKVAELFYEYVYGSVLFSFLADDEHPEFRDMFRNGAPIDLAVYSQQSFLIQVHACHFTFRSLVDLQCGEE